MSHIWPTYLIIMDPVVDVCSQAEVTAYLDSVIPESVVVAPILEMLAGALGTYFPKDYAEEIEGLAEVSGIKVGGSAELLG